MSVSGSLCLAWQVHDKHCLVIGAGEVAYSRIVHLLRAHAKITVITGAGHVHPQIEALEPELHALIRREYHLSDLRMYEQTDLSIDLDDVMDHVGAVSAQINETFANVCCCIDDYELSTKIYHQCKYLRLPVNIADKPPLCDFYFGSMFNQDNLQIMISTNGKSPRLSKLIKDTIARQFEGVDVNRAVENLGLIRSTLRSNVVIDDDLVSIDTRMNWIKQLTDFFEVKQWAALDISKGAAEAIVGYFPGYPPKDFVEFSDLVAKHI